ncbi:uncharacterized protein B0I36DRAFT_430828 [Microdochium trichocladiopsis]|uniref:Uncharacterized protein n=1 Tax=Microdochium trichocladiopsis TaxID=1682393 RepID=A0A9P9BVT5_9PEZI|nr:uncharacterized protein B0I36DRAFT_430828 [Microdochium trichocladiopsis]KAH7033657.1 hypothetical protein B0I36DRAFT_430828 [Microdochium trichocladiopsis]
MADTRDPTPIDDRVDNAREQVTSPKEEFPAIPDPSLEAQSSLSTEPPQSSSPAQAVQTTTTATVPNPTDPTAGSNTLVWLPPSQYSAIRDKWQDQFIWSPTAFASDLPVNQTSFISVNRSRENSAVTKPPFSTLAAAGQIEGVETLGDVAEPVLQGSSDGGGVDGEDQGKGGNVDGDKERDRSDHAGHEQQEEDDELAAAGGQKQPTTATEQRTTRSQPQQTTPPSKWAKNRPAKTKHWHSFHLLKNTGARSRRNSSSSQTSNSNDNNAGSVQVPSLPGRRQPIRGQKGGRTQGIGRIPVLVPHPKSYEEDEEKKKASNARNRHRSRSGQSRGKSRSKGGSGDGGKGEPTKSLLTPAAAASPSRTAKAAKPKSGTMQAAEQAVQDAVRQQTTARGGSVANNTIIVAEMPEDGNDTPRKPLVLPAGAAQARGPLADIAGSNLQVPEGSSRSRKTRRSPRRRATLAENNASAAGTQQSQLIQTQPGRSKGKSSDKALDANRPGKGRSKQPQPTTHSLPADSNNSIIISKNGIIPTSPSARSVPTTAVSKQKTSSSQICVNLNINLDVEVHLKAKLHGDVTLTLFE